MIKPDYAMHQPSDPGRNASRLPMARGRMSWNGARHVKNGLRLVLALAAFTLLFYWLCGIGHVSIHHPFQYTGDALEKLAYQVGDYTANDVNTRMRAPFESAKAGHWRYEYNALFQSDSNLIWVAKLLGGGDAPTTLNFAYLLTFLLVFLSGYWVCGRLGLRDPFRFCAASLFALMPYHFQRGEYHFLESTYYFVPFMALVMLELWSARPVAFEWTGHRWAFAWRDKRLWFALFLLTFLTSFNPYHQFFFACLVAAAAPFAATYRRNWRPWLVGWGLAVFACAVLVLKHALAQHLVSPELMLGTNGQVVGMATYGQAEKFPLKITQLLLPVQGHRWDVLASLRNMYDVANPMNNENNSTTLGAVGAVGFLACIVLALLPATRWRTSTAGKMGLIALIAVLFGSMGGFSSLISTVSVMILGIHSMLVVARAWDRIVLFIGFFAYFTAFWLLQRWIKSVAPRSCVGWKRAALVWTAGALMFAFALWDQVPYKIGQQHSGHYLSDIQFFGKLESELPKNSRVFQLPYVIHHWSGWVRPGVYYTEQLRPYIASRTLRFTYGGDLGSVQSEWYHAAAALPSEQAAPYLCRYGFAGVLIQRNMLEDPVSLEKKWETVLADAPKVSKDGDYSFFDLRSYCHAHGVRSVDMSSVKTSLIDQIEKGRHFVPGGAFDHHIGHALLQPDGNIVLAATANESGWLAYGPREPLKPGRYKATFKFSRTTSTDGGSLSLDINAQGPTQQVVLGKLSFMPGPSVGSVAKTLEFTVTRELTGMEYRVVKSKGVGTDFLGVEIQRLPGDAEPGTNTMSAQPRAGHAQAPVRALPAGHFRARLTLAGLPELTVDEKKILVTVNVTNDGVGTFGSGVVPHQVNLGAHSIDASGKIVDNDLARGRLPQIAPGATAEATILLPIAATFDRRAELLPVQEGVAWFDKWGTKPLIIGPFQPCDRPVRGGVCDASGKPLAVVSQVPQ